MADTIFNELLKIIDKEKLKNMNADERKKLLELVKKIEEETKNIEKEINIKKQEETEKEQKMKLINIIKNNSKISQIEEQMQEIIEEDTTNINQVIEYTIHKTLTYNQDYVNSSYSNNNYNNYNNSLNKIKNNLSELYIKQQKDELNKIIKYK